MGIQIHRWCLLVVEADAVPGAEHNLQDSSNARRISVRSVSVNDNARADFEFPIPFSFFDVVRLEHLGVIQIRPPWITPMGDPRANVISY